MTTLTLSKVEQETVLLNLEQQRGRLTPDNRDGPILEGLSMRIKASTTNEVTKLEAFVMLRHLRVRRFKLGNDMMALEERRVRGGFNGTLDAAHKALDAEATVLDDVMRRLWEVLGT